MLTTLIEIGLLLLLAYGVTAPPKPKLKHLRQLAEVEDQSEGIEGFLGIFGVATCQVLLTCCLVFRNVIGGKLYSLSSFESNNF